MRERMIEGWSKPNASKIFQCTERDNSLENKSKEETNEVLQLNHLIKYSRDRERDNALLGKETQN